MQPGDKVLIRARKSESPYEPVVIEQIVSRVIDSETIEYGRREYYPNIAKYGTGLGCWCLPEDDLKAHAVYSIHEQTAKETGIGG